MDNIHTLLFTHEAALPSVIDRSTFFKFKYRIAEEQHKQDCKSLSIPLEIEMCDRDIRPRLLIGNVPLPDDFCGKSFLWKAQFIKEVCRKNAAKKISEFFANP